MFNPQRVMPVVKRAAQQVLHNPFGGKARRVLISPGGAAVAAAAVEGARRYYRGGSRAPASLQGLVTQQYDFTPGPVRRRMSKRMKIRKRIYKRYFRRFKRKVRKAQANKGGCRINFFYSAGRSFTSALGGAQNLITIPVLAYRGIGTTSASVANGAASNPEYFFRTDHCNVFHNHYDGNLLFPNGPASNQVTNFWWFQVDRAVVDITLSNVSFGETGFAGSAGAKIEYEIYWCRPGKKLPYEITRTINLIGDVDTINSTDGQYPGDDPAAVTRLGPISDPNWGFWHREHAKKYIRTRLLGRGYIPNANSVRFHKSVKIKAFINKKRWDKLDQDPIDNKGFFGPARYMCIVFRGMPTSGTTTGGYNRARLNVNVNWAWYTKGSGPVGASTYSINLAANDFA